MLDHHHLATIAYDIQTRGYSLLPGYLSADDCARLRRLTQAAIDEFKPFEGSERSYLDRHQMHDLLCRDAGFTRLLEDPRLQLLMEPFIGKAWIMYAFTSSSIAPGDRNYSARVHVDSPRFQPGYITNMGIIWTLDEYRADNGPLRVLPGSQHSAQLPDEDYFDANCVEVHCPPGTAIIFNARLAHRTGINTSDAWRHSLTMNCCRCFMKQRMDWVRFVPAAISDRLNPQARRLLGFDTRLPASLAELFVPEEQRLYKGGQE